MTVLVLALAATTLAICAYYVLLLAIASVDRRRRSRRPTRHATPARPPQVVVVVPARDEALVIARTVERVQQLEGEPVLLVVDDGSGDDTASVAREAADRDRTIVLRRPPHAAGRGKGDVLNAAVAHLLRMVAAGDVRLRGHGADDIVVCVLDADGWLDRDAIPRVLPLFADPSVAGVQVSVRMWNARAGFLARMQDIEFVAYGHLFQAARNVIGSVLMGGNGQFMRLSAVRSLGPRPWSDSLTEDLDIGLRLVCRGWRLRACPETFVAQQAIDSPRRFVRQRTRWVQGHLGCWQHLPGLWHPRAGLPLRARADLALHLLLGAYGVLAMLQLVALAGILAGRVDWHAAAPFASPVAAATLVGVLVLLPVLVVATTYQRHAEARLAPTTLAGVFVAYLAYHYLWSIPATTLAALRLASGRSGWSKTNRQAISQHDLAADAAAAGAST